MIVSETLGALMLGEGELLRFSPLSTTGVLCEVILAAKPLEIHDFDLDVQLD